MTAAASAAAVAQTLSPRFERLESSLGKAKNTLATEVAPLGGVKEEVTKTSLATNSLTKAVESSTT